MKRCRTCEQELPDDRFYKNHATCKACLLKKRKARRESDSEYDAKLREKSKAYFVHLNELARELRARKAAQRAARTIPKGKRVCRTCHEIKPVSDFESYGLGLSLDCKECKKKMKAGQRIIAKGCKELCPRYPCFSGIDTIETINPYYCHDNPKNKLR